MLIQRSSGEALLIKMYSTQIFLSQYPGLAVKGLVNVGKSIYEVGDLFPWEMLTKMMISYLLNVEKKNTWNSPSEIDFDLAQKMKCKLHYVTVQNSVTPIKPAIFKMNTHVTEDILLNNTGIIHKLNFHPHFREIVILSNLYKSRDKNAAFFRLVQQEINVAYETSTFWPMFMLR